MPARLRISASTPQLAAMGPEHNRRHERRDRHTLRPQCSEERRTTMTMLRIPVRWYGGTGYYRGDPHSDGYRYDTLELELARTAFMIVDSDCGEGNTYVEYGIAPALAAARRVGMRVLFI